MAGRATSSWRPIAPFAAKSITIQILMSLAAPSLIASTSNSPWAAGPGAVHHLRLGRSPVQSQPPGAPAATQAANFTSETDAANELERFKRRTMTSRLGSAAGKVPEFAGPIGNVSAVVGRDVRLVCTVENLGQHQVAWLKEETKTILSIDTNIIITNYRIFLIPDDEGRKWVLHIKDVQESDRGSYQCQINTSPMRSISGHLDVVVPPALIETESTQVLEVMEHANVSLQCKASGHPRPTIGWRREDGESIKLSGGGGGGGGGAPAAGNEPRLDKNSSITTGPNQRRAPRPGPKKPSSEQAPITHLNDIRSDRLSLTNVDRTMAGLYICTASNGIPSPASRQIPLYVKFLPKVTIPVETIAVNLGEQLDIDCLIEAFPKPTSYWSERQLAEPAPASLPSQARLSSYELQRHRFSAPSRWPRQGNKVLMEGLFAPGASGNSLAGSLPKRGRQQQQQQQPLKRQINDRSEEADEDEHLNVSLPSVLSPPRSDDAEQIRAPNQRPEAANKAFVTVKQTAVNPYTYKLRISISRMRPSDFGEYVCTSSNSLGTSSARVLVKRAERDQSRIDDAATLARQISPPEASDNQAGYQRDAMMSSGHSPQAVWSSSPFIQAQKAHRSQQSDARQGAPSRQSNRVYDENYLQSIRNRQPSGFVVSSSAFGSERNGVQSARSRQQANMIWLTVPMIAVLLGL